MGGRDRPGIGSATLDSHDQPCPRTPNKLAAPGTVGQLGVADLLALQRSAGNAATGALFRQILARQAGAITLPEVQIQGEAWTTEDTKAIQIELRRLRLYTKRIDGILGFFTEQGLTEAFGGDSWQTLEVSDLLDRLRAAQRPAAGGGHALRYAELFKDGVLDVTLGLGFREGHASDMTAMVSAVGANLIGAGFTRDDQAAADILKSAGRSVHTGGVSTFFVKPAAFLYSPPAGTAISVDVVVRVVANPGGDQGAEAADAFRAGMIQGDIAYYFGHARYGTGPDFDPAFGGFTLTAADGTQQTPADVHQLEEILKQEGDPWRLFEQRVNQPNPPSISVTLSNAGNVYLNDRNPHVHTPGEEFGSQLTYWALAQDRVTETGPGGALAAGPDASGRNYRVLAFAGCDTHDFDVALRSTPGFDARSADVIETTRVINLAGGGAESFISFLNGVMAQGSAESIIGGMNAQMRLGEGDAFQSKAAPFTISGIGDNPLQ